MTSRTTKQNGLAGIYEVTEDGEHVGMIMGSEHYTGERLPLLDSQPARRAHQPHHDTERPKQYVGVKLQCQFAYEGVPHDGEHCYRRWNILPPCLRFDAFNREEAR